MVEELEAAELAEAEARLAPGAGATAVETPRGGGDDNELDAREVGVVSPSAAQNASKLSAARGGGGRAGGSLRSSTQPTLNEFLIPLLLLLLLLLVLLLRLLLLLRASVCALHSP